jgi:hypothetical protein
MSVWTEFEGVVLVCYSRHLMLLKKLIDSYGELALLGELA